MTQIIILERDISNPKPDRRSTNIFNAPTIPAGTRFVDNGSSLSISGSHKRFGHFTHRNSDIGKLVVANSCSVPPCTAFELSQVFADGVDSTLILDALIKLHVITAEDFVAASKQIDLDYSD